MKIKFKSSAPFVVKTENKSILFENGINIISLKDFENIIKKDKNFFNKDCFLILEETVKETVEEIETIEEIVEVKKKRNKRKRNDNNS